MMRRNEQQNKKDPIDFPNLECVNRLGHIPIVEAGWGYAGQMYTRIKNSNSLIQWTFGTAESSLNTALETALPPTVAVFGGPINVIDKLLCKSLDVVEQRVPNINLPPHIMYNETKQYLNSKIICPVLKRADSVKQIGNTVLASKYTEFAADKLEGALNVADKYVDKYLPDNSDHDQTLNDSQFKITTVDGPTRKAIQTFNHIDRFSRKLQRRLTKRTLSEAKALKIRSQESIHILLYIAELVATDPKSAVEKVRQLWITLSEREPENQQRPENLEQLLVLLTRESARRVVHFVNFTRLFITKLPDTISRSVNATTRQCMDFVDGLVKTAHLEEVTNAAAIGAKARAQKLNVVLHQFNEYANVILERMALIIAGQPQPKKPIKVHHGQKQRNNHHQPHVQSSPTRNQYKVTSRSYTNNVINNGAHT